MCLCYANETTQGESLDSFNRSWPHQKDDAHMERVGTSNSDPPGRPEGLRLSSVIANDLISHAYIMKSHIKTLVMEVSGASWFMNFLMHW